MLAAVICNCLAGMWGCLCRYGDSGRASGVGGKHLGPAADPPLLSDVEGPPNTHTNTQVFYDPENNQVVSVWWFTTKTCDILKLVDLRFEL